MNPPIALPPLPITEAAQEHLVDERLDRTQLRLGTLWVMLRGRQGARDRPAHNAPMNTKSCCHTGNRPDPKLMLPTELFEQFHFGFLVHKRHPDPIGITVGSRTGGGPKLASTPGPKFDSIANPGRCWDDDAIHPRLVPHRNADPARDAGSRRVASRQSRPDAGKDRDRRRGRTSALAHLERQGEECHGQHRSVRKNSANTRGTRLRAGCGTRCLTSTAISEVRVVGSSTTPSDTVPSCASELRSPREPQTFSSIGE